MSFEKAHQIYQINRNNTLMLSNFFEKELNYDCAQLIIEYYKKMIDHNRFTKIMKQLNNMNFDYENVLYAGEIDLVYIPEKQNKFKYYTTINQYILYSNRIFIKKNYKYIKKEDIYTIQ